MTLPTFATAASLVFRDFIVDGNAGSGTFLPLKSDERAWGGVVEQTLDALLSRSTLIGGAIVPSVLANVLTIAVKTTAGNDPSATRPVYVDIRNTTANSGLPHLVAITAPLSLVISAGSTMGFTNGVPGRVWVSLFYDAGTLRLGAFNAYGGANGILYPLVPSLVASSTAEGGIGGADSAGVFYTGAAVAAKPFIVLGHLTWETALATAGNWSALPDVTHNLRPGDPLAGDLVQRQASVDGAFNSNSTTTPFDNTIPQNTEGVQFMSLAITPQSKANILEVDHLGNYSGSVAGHVTAALHQDAVVNALAARAGKVTATNDVLPLALRYRALAALNVATTFKVRAGLSTAGTTGFNGTSAAGLFGGVGSSSLEISERMG